MIKNLQKTKNFMPLLCLVLFIIAACKTTEPAADIKAEQSLVQTETVVGEDVKPAASSEKVQDVQKKAEQKAPAQTQQKKQDAFTAEAFTGNLQKLLQKGDMKQALDSFDAIPETHKNNEDLNYMHASLLLSAGEVQKAAEKTAALVKQNPGNENIQLLSAMVARAGGDGKKSTEIIRSILKKNPKNPDANAALANSFMLVRNFKQANLYFKKGLEGNPEHSACLFGYGQTSWYLNDIDKAKATFIKLSVLEPENDMAWSYLAKLSGEARDYEKALEYIQKATALNPDDYHHQLDAGSYYLGLEKPNEAEKAWTKAIKIEPDYFLAYTYRGGLRDEQGKYESALDDYRNVIRCNPKYYYAYESVAMLAWRIENWEEALQGFVKASEMNPENTSYKLMISACYRKMNNSAANKEYLSKAMRNMDKQSLDYLMLRLYYDELGDGNVLHRTVNQDSRTIKGKMLFYMALFYELTGKKNLAHKIYLEVADMQSPLFFEYRLTQWAVEKMSETEKRTAAEDRAAEKAR
ncbi:tetratricopeptide repeat protein [Treponema sp. HNW]|uniref:tetratricopeptide repeat protein n=1 Tax=Treponema sp. HNW TaxID=3116654 RepID=UPI003D0BF75C